MLRTILHRPIAVTMTLIAIVTLGVLALGRIPVSLMPDIDVPRIVVQMSAQGSSAREIEQRMVGPMRRQLSQVAGLKDIESTSRTDAGLITLTFSPGSDMSLLFIEVNEKIDRAMSFMPKEMERPKVMKIGALDIPAFYVDVTGGKPEQTSRLVSNVISKRLEQLPEVAMVDYSGLTGTQITIRPDEACAGLSGITNAEIEKAISDNNIVLEALSVRDGISRYNIHFDSQILSVHDIENIYLRHNGRLLQLKDICKVEETAAVRKGVVSSDGKDAITMAVIKQSDAQMSDLQQSVDTLMAQLAGDYPDLHFAVTRDQTRLLSYSMNNLEWNLVLGIVMASVVLFVFIGGRRLPLLVAISIPLSLILTLLCFYLMGISLNIISLSGLILGVGMIVDNAIIVIDNILQKGTCNERTISAAVKEVVMPMLSSVLTTCSVFIPLIFLSGTAGALFFDQAMGITIALFCSLAVATLVVPVYHLALCRECRPRVNKINIRMTALYEKGMRYTLRHPKSMACVFMGSMIVTALLLPFIPKERMPETPHDDALITIDWNEGIVAEENNRRVKEVLGSSVKELVKASTTMAGGQDFMLSHTRNITG
ncbi:MAG: efflux RND transporter permease subunit, partial [Prevotella sp.]|nr:efflux RND transporter permease subunit [Prevotella sp.]